MPAPTTYSLDLIKSALRLIGVLASGDSPTADDANDALTVLNQMVDGWNAEQLMIYGSIISEFSLIASQQTYTCGSGGDFNMERPSQIDRMSFVSLNNPAQPLELPIKMLTDQEWQAIPVKLISNSMSFEAYDDGAFPLRRITFRFIPTIAAKTRIYSWSAIAQFADLSTTVYSFPPAYLKALRYNLAVDLAAEFGPVPPDVLALVWGIAQETKANIKRLNTSLVDLQCDAAVVSRGQGRYNWLTDGE